MTSAGLPSLRPSPLMVALRLGRVSNVPTVFTNVAAGLALAGGQPLSWLSAILGLAVAAFYVGGMYLNDGFDAAWDAQHRPERPIPSGQVRRSTVLIAGFGLLAVGMMLVLLAAASPSTLGAAFALGALIVIYDVAHKQNPLSPLVMAACRVAVYVLAAAAVVPFPPPRPVWFGALALALYLVFLSTLARKETIHPKLPKMIGTLVAGIALVDAGVLAICGHMVAAALAVAAFFLTRFLQKSVPGS
ncbi:MAG TPA: UbiA family prenyltransferase [Polyangia bacterium]